MNILLLSTLKRNVTANSTASRSRVVYQLAKGLAEKGHSVTLLGTADSFISGVKVIPVIDKGWIDLPPAENPFVRDIGTLTLQTTKMLELQHKFDIIHNHVFPDFYPHIVENQLTTPLVTTLHSVAETYLDDILGQFHKSYFVALSKGYTKNLHKTKPFAIAYNGVDTNIYKYSSRKEDYLLWIGRLNSAKNVDGTYIDPKGVRWAIQLAEETDSKLFMLGPVHDKKAFDTDVKPHLSSKIKWVGEVNGEQSVPQEKVVSLIQHAKAFLMTINQEEPFGLVMAEAMSCGTPIIAFNKGSVAEIVKDGITGFVVSPNEGVDGLKRALENINSIRPNDCYEHVKKHFSIEAMVNTYEEIYKEILKKYSNK